MAQRKRQQRKNRRIERAALELLRDPKFLFNVGQEIGAAGVVGELRNRLILFLACLTTVFDRGSVSVLMKGSSSTGKSNLVRAVLKLIPPELVLTRSSLSKKALAYGASNLAGKILYLMEIHGGRDAQFYTRLLQSEGALVHEATTVTGGNRGTAVATRAGVPLILSTTTDERVYPDDETRYLSLRADESSGLTREVLRSQFRQKQQKNKEGK